MVTFPGGFPLCYLQKAETLIFSHNSSDFFELIIPMLYLFPIKAKESREKAIHFFKELLCDLDSK